MLLIYFAGGFLFKLLRCPPLLGMLLSGMALRNAAPMVIEGLPATWSTVIRSLALGTIFLRSGLELDFRVFKSVGPAAVRLLLLPGDCAAACMYTCEHYTISKLKFSMIVAAAKWLAYINVIVAIF